MSSKANYTVLPSASRVVVIDGFGPFPRGTLQMAPSSLVWPVKDPGDTLDYVVDYSEAIAGDSNDAIATLDVQIAPNLVGDLTLVSSSADGDQAILWLASGQVGTNYAVTVVAGTNGGRTIARTVTLPVAALATVSAFGTILTNQSGAALTDQTHAALTTS